MDEGESESEAAPLVVKPSGGLSSIAPAARGVEKDSHGHEAPPSKTLAEECRVIFALAWPQSLSFCLSMGAQQANVAFVGHLGATELGAASGAGYPPCQVVLVGASVGPYEFQRIFGNFR